MGPGSDLRRLRALVNDVDAVIWEVDATTGRFVFVSDASSRLLGYPPQAFLDDPDLWADRVHPDDRDAVLTSLLAETSGPGTHDLEYRFRRGDGEVVRLRGIGHAVVDDRGSPVAVRGVLVDISRRDPDAERPAGAGGDVTAAGARTPSETGAGGLLAAVSHDLRTPLAAILGLAVTLEHHALAPTDASDLAGRIADNARRLDRMVTDLLDLDRLSRGGVEPTRVLVDLGSVVARIVRDADSLAKYEVVVEAEHVDVEADVAQVERIVENLLENAARRSPSSATIRVRVRTHRDGARIEVEDDGPRVPSDRQHGVFGPFGQEGLGRTATSGIGLAIAARFAELHGGSADVEDRGSQGTSFGVWLPWSSRSGEPT